jgi:ABC-type polysaccharide/polyol phosphate export permease
MLQPLLMLTILYAVFSRVFRFHTENYPVYVLSGVLFWSFFSQSVLASMESLRSNRPLVLRFPLPLVVLPIAAVLSGTVNLLLAMTSLLILLPATGHPFTSALWSLPFAVVVGATFTLGVGLLLAPLAVFFHDVVELVRVLLLMLYFLTPVFYPRTILPEVMATAVSHNPLTVLLETFRAPLHQGQPPSLATAALATSLAALALALGSTSFARLRHRIPFYL